MKNALLQAARCINEATLSWRALLGNLIRCCNATGTYVAPSVRRGRNVKLGRHCKLYRDVLVGDVAIGDYSYVAEGAHVTHATIGNFSSIGPQSWIGLGIHPSAGWFSTHPAFFSLGRQCGITFAAKSKTVERKTVAIGADVWIGAGAMILDGIVIETGAIIGAGAVVTKNVPPFEIWAGVPARRIGVRFDDPEVRSLLINSKWWEAGEAVLRRLEELPWEDEKKFYDNVRALHALTSREAASGSGYTL